MTYYLLQSDDTHHYLLMYRDKTTEYYCNGGSWSVHPPHTETEFSRFSTDDYDGRNWWLPRYYNTVDARLIYRCNSLETYKKWVSQHPEYFI